MSTGAEGSEWRTMADADLLTLQVCPGLDDEAEDLAELAALLRGELLDLDIAAVEPLERESLPPGTKGGAAVFGWLAVNLGPAALRAVLARVADWATRNGRTVEVTDGGDTLKLGQATREQQERIIDAWLARHPTGS